MSTSTTHKAPLNGRGRPAAGSPVAPARLPRGPRRNLPLAALAVVLILGCGAVSGALYLSADERITVVAAARDLPAGTVITAADLTDAELTGSGFAAIPGDAAYTLIGKTMVGPTPEGTLLNAGMVLERPRPVEGTVAVGLALRPGQLPAGQLAAGRDVVIFEVPAVTDGQVAAPVEGGDAGDAGSMVLVDRAEVLSVTPDAAGTYLVTVMVDAASARAVSAAGFASRVTVGLLPLEGAG